LLIADCQLLRLTAAGQSAIGNLPSAIYFCSLCAVCFLQNRQYLLSSIRSVVFFLFLLVL
jgi:hypothetical protein